MSRVTYSLLLIISLTAGLTLWYVTPAGLGLTNDSAAYIGGARSILAGTGYSDVWLDSSLESITHYPPLLSLILSGFGLLGLDPYRGARVLNIFLFAANTGLIGLLGSRLAVSSEGRMTKSQIARIFLALLFVTNAQLLKIHVYVLSEPLFLFFSSLSFLFFDISVENQKSKATSYWLLITGFFTGLAFLTRYSGLALIATFLLSTLLLYRNSRLKRIAIFLAGAIPPIAAWFIRNALVAESATNRTFQYHAIELKNIRFGLRNFSQFLTPFENWQNWLFESGLLSALLITLGLILLIWLAFSAWKLLFQSPNQKITKSPNPLAFTTALYTFAYLGAVLFSMSFFDASTKFQHRILSPLYVSWMALLVALLVAGLTQKIFASFRVIRVQKGFVPVLAILILGLSTFNLRQTILDLREAGQGYASWKWRDSVVMADLKKLPPDVAIYTNTTPAVYLVTGRASRVIPSTFDPVDNRPRGDYQQNLAQIRADLLAGRAVLALFDTSNIEDALGVETVGDFSSGLKVLEKAQGDILYGKP